MLESQSWKKQNSKCESWKNGGPCQSFWPLPSQISAFWTVLKNWKGIWNWNLVRNLIMASPIMALCTVLFHTILRFTQY